MRLLSRPGVLFNKNVEIKQIMKEFSFSIECDIDFIGNDKEEKASSSLIRNISIFIVFNLL